MSSPFSPVRRTLAGFLLALAVAALAGCAAPQPAATTAPATPAPATPSAEPTPSATPTASPSPTSTASAAALPYCGDEFIADRSSIVWWMGTQEEQLAQAAPEPGFVAAEALAGLDVVCAITYRSPTDGEHPPIGDAERLVALTGAPPDAIYVWHADFTLE